MMSGGTGPNPSVLAVVDRLIALYELKLRMMLGGQDMALKDVGKGRRNNARAYAVMPYQHPGYRAPMNAGWGGYNPCAVPHWRSDHHRKNWFTWSNTKCGRFRVRRKRCPYTKVNLNILD